jgi:membrane-anchored glycerophosphoryl diester phosphodiesterase (GDPDase)
MMLVQSYLTLSFYKLILTLIYKEYYEFEFGDIIPSFKMALNFVVIGLCMVVLVGTIIFINNQLQEYTTLMLILDKVEILALAYVLIRSIFCLCFIVDDDSGPIESLKQSFSITKNNFFKLVVLILIVLIFIAVLLVLINGVITLFTTENTTSEAYILKIAGIFWFALSFPTVQVMIMTTYKRLVYSHQDVDDDIAETN